MADIHASSIGALGESDDTLALQSALDSLAPGDTLILGTHHFISQSLRVGNGSHLQQSTQAAFTVRGTGLPGFHSSGPWAGETLLTWIGPTDPTTPMMIVDGPIVGLDLGLIHFDCALKAGYGLIVRHAQRSRFSDIIVQNFLTNPYWLRAYQSAADTWNGMSDNTWIQCSSTGPGDPYANGIRIGEDTITSPYAPINPTTLDVCRNTFINCWWACGTNGYGIDVGFADNLVFQSCTTYQGKGLRLTAPLGAITFPTELTFLHCSLSSGIESSGIHPSAGKVLFWPYQVGDGAAVPTTAGAPTALGVTTQGRFFGRWRGLPVTLCSSVLTASVPASSTQETVLGAGYDLPADTMSDQGGVLEISAAGTCVAPNPGRQLTLRTRLGGVSGPIVAERTLTIGPEAIAGCGWSLAARAACRFGGPNGSFIQAGGVFDVGGVMYGSTKAGAAQILNTRVNQLVVITAQWGAIDTSGASVSIGSFRVSYCASP